MTSSQVSYVNWLKVTIAGAAGGYLSLTSCASIFKGSWGIFSAFLGVQTSIYVKFMVIIYALEHA